MLRYLFLSCLSLVVVITTVSAETTRGPQNPSALEALSVTDVVQEIVDRILTSDSTLSGKNVVRFMLKDSVLPGTEVRVVKEMGKMHVSFVTSSDTSLYRISANGWTIQAELQKRLNYPVRVDLRTVEIDSEDGGSPGQRPAP